MPFGNRFRPPKRRLSRSEKLAEPSHFRAALPVEGVSVKAVKPDMREVYVELTEIQLSATHTLKNESEHKKQRETGVIGKYPGIIEQLPDIFPSHHLALEVQQALILLQKYPKSQETNGFLGETVKNPLRGFLTGFLQPPACIICPPGGTNSTLGV